MIKNLPTENPILYNEFGFAVRNADYQGKFIRNSMRFPLTAIGDINTYSIFAELFFSMVNKSGRLGIIVPTGIATDENNKNYFSKIIDENSLISLFDFENKKLLFHDVHRSSKFCLITISGHINPPTHKPKFAFYLTDVSQINDPIRVFNLSKDDFLKLNPNTKTSPIIRTKQDAVILAKIYNSTPVFINEALKTNHWGIEFMTMFHMSNDSYLFKTESELANEGFVTSKNWYVNDSVNYLPLYEGKMFMPFNHRYANVIVNNENLTRKGQSEENTQSDLINPEFYPTPQYWVNESDVLKKYEYKNKPYIAFKAVTSALNERTVLATYLPYSAIHDNAPIILSNVQDAVLNTCLLANLNALTLDYVARQKVGNIKIMFYVIEQFPIISPEDYPEDLIQLIATKVLELTYTSWDIKHFADDIWKDGDTILREAIQRQWEENKSATGGFEFTSPDWCEVDAEGIKLPPFKWNEERRAVLKAELDAIYAKLYGLNEQELRYVLDPQDVYGEDFPGETFRVLKEREIKKFGEYRTKRLVLEAWEKLK